ncbi:MAG TPA: nucleoside monophosphate kinase [Thermomicrobiales bacterium]|nr:nucleoside monophosphate kinase [Thermomicrobiales bacterium]
MQHVVFIGPQGAGKGTQAAEVAPKFGLVHLATGDLFRSLMAEDTTLAQEVRTIYDRGDLVPDELTARVLFDSLDRRSDAESVTGALIDGFPRNAAQARILDDSVAARDETLAAVVHIVVPRDVLMQRLTGRLICRNCGRSYHETFNPPVIEGVCDACGGELYTRSDDTPEAVARRLDIYFEQTEPLLDHWRASGIVHDVDGDAGIEDVTASIEDVLSGVLDTDRN